jgi:hypothetical protein
MAFCVQSELPITEIIQNCDKPVRKRYFVYLAYLDDSEQHDWQVICAVLMPADSFLLAEFLSAMTIEDLMPEEIRHKFQEFHASELYNGEGAFKDIDQQTRFAAIGNLLLSLGSCGAHVAYGSVNLARLRNSPYGSANSRDVSFRRCVLGAADWISGKVLHEMQGGRYGNEFTTLFIMDEAAQSDKETQRTLLKSFRSLRSRFRFSDAQAGQLSFVHDDMYFGDSRYSIGIQIADLCSYFIAKHLCGEVECEGFYKMIEPYIVSTGKEE